MKNIVPIIIGLMIISMEAQSQIIPFDGNLEKAEIVGGKENKNVFIFITAEWCKPCKYVIKEGFSNTEVGEVYNEKYLTIVIDEKTELGKDIKEKYQLTAYPSFLFIKPTGEEIRKIGGLVGEPAEWLLEIHAGLYKDGLLK